MSVRFLPACLIAAALLAAGFLSHVLAHRAVVCADDGAVCPKCAACPSQTAATPPACCCEKMETRTYSVADLVIPIPCGNGCNAMPQPAPAPCPMPAPLACTTAAAPQAANIQMCSPPQTTENELIKLIVRAVAPDSWQEKGGKGTIDYFPLTMSMVVNQTCAVHAQIAEMFKSLRQHQDVQVAVEVRFISLSEECYERLKKDFGLEGNGAKVGTSPEMHVSFHDDKQVYQMLEVVQGDCRANIMQAPKVTLFNGQGSTIDITEKKQFVTGVKANWKNGQTIVCPETETITLGTLLSVQPVVSADQRLVRLKLDASLTSLVRDEAELFPVITPIWPRDDKGTAQEPVVFTQFIQQPCLNSLNLKTSIELPAGRSAVLSGWKRTKERLQDDTPPVVKDIPFLNEAFKSTKFVRETECVLMMVTPRIIISAEEEKGAFEEEEEMCWPFGKEEPVPCPASDCCKEKGAIEVQSKGSLQIGVGVSSDLGVTGSIILKANFPTCEVAELLEKYHKACIEGRRAEATELAVRALALDPTCFHKATCGGKGEK
jgi:hypothetical protein